MTSIESEEPWEWMLGERVESSFEGPEASPGFLLWRLTNEWQRVIRAALTPVGITHVQFVLLTCLGWMEDQGRTEISQKDLADQAGTDPMMTSQVVRALMEAGHISREPSKTDQRAFWVSLTASGAEVVKVALPLVEGADRGFFAENRGKVERLASLSRGLSGLKLETPSP